MKYLKSVLIAAAFALTLSGAVKAQDMDPCADISNTVAQVYDTCLLTQTCEECVWTAWDALQYWSEYCDASLQNHMRALVKWNRMFEGCFGYPMGDY